MDKYEVSGWASAGVSTNVEAESYQYASEKARAAMADKIQQMDPEVLKDRLVADIEVTETERL